MTWDDLEYWSTGEWQVVQERLDDSDRKGIRYFPSRVRLFNSLDQCPLDTVRVVIMGQDPYCSHKYATGLAFSIPSKVQRQDYPPTLVNLLKEYEDDLHPDKAPLSGDLSIWCSRGVLLWNCIPSVGTAPLSHNWVEWEYLTREIVDVLDKKCCVVFILLGKIARQYHKLITSNSEVIVTSHPSPRGSRFGFLGSRIFSTANSKLVEQGLPAIDWRL